MRVLILCFAMSIFCEAGFPDTKSYEYDGAKGKQTFDIYFPKNHRKTAKAPCIILFHGGGWSGGDSKQMEEMCRYFSSRGMVSVSGNYSKHDKKNLKGLSKGESRKRVCVMDGKSVYRWVIDNHKDLGIDLNKLVAGGASAGGHIALMAYLDKDYNNSGDSNTKIDIKAFLLYCPAFTLEAIDRTPDVNVFKKLAKNMPPMLFIVGKTDKWKKASDSLVMKLRSKGTEVSHMMGPKVGHMFHRTTDWKMETFKVSDQFLIDEGILKGKPTAKSTGNKKLLVID